MEKLIQINLKISESWIEQLKSLARKESAKRDQDINYLEYIRLILKESLKLEEYGENR